MNVALVVANYSAREGTGGYVVELATRLVHRHQLTIYAMTTETDPPAQATFVRVPAIRGRAFATILSYPFALARVRRPHDIVHVQGWLANHADVVTAHIVTAAWRRAQRDAGQSPRLGERLFGGIVARQERRLVQRARAVIAPSTGVAQQISQHYRREPGVHVIPHGFRKPSGEMSRVAARRAIGHDSGFLALYVGDPAKGLSPLLDALTHTPDVHLAVLSRTSTVRSRQQAAALGLADRTLWIDPSTPADVAYAAADVLVHPSIYDTFALPVAEAMGHGLAVIASRCCGVSELIRHDESGWIIDGELATGTAQALAALVADDARRSRLGAGGRRVAEARGWDRVADEVDALYQRVQG